MTLDHLIATVPDIRATHRRLLGLGFEEAWPIGPFWPVALTSGVALGGANLELVQPDAGADEARIETLVLAPADHKEAVAFMAPFNERQRDKDESDPHLLALRGFPPEMAARTQRICDNRYPGEGEAKYPFFLCLYAPFLKDRLAPSNFAAPRGSLTKLALVAPEPEAVRRLFAGHLGPVELEVDTGERSRVAAIQFADGSTLTAGDL